MKDNNLEYKIVDFGNALDAIDIQRKIFSGDGMINILASLDRDLFISVSGIHYIDDHIKYYLVCDGDVKVGIVGLYYYPDDDESMWLGWFGVLSEYRGRGYGRVILNWAMNEVLRCGRKYLRLYTDKDENIEAIKLYEKLGFIGEKYISEELDYNCYIYSKSVVGNDIELWNNRYLGLKNQSQLEVIDEMTKENILNKYKQAYLNK